MRPTLLLLVLAPLSMWACSGEATESHDAASDAVSPDASVIENCADVGASCKTISECSKGAGLLVDATCASSSIAGAVCCAEPAACPEETYACCDDGGEFRPSCDPKTQTLRCLRGEPC